MGDIRRVMSIIEEERGEGGGRLLVVVVGKFCTS
jgi:hypothetical protein